MKAGTERKLNAIWYGGAAVPAWLRALVPVYRAAWRLDRWRQLRACPENLDGLVIVVVGNLTAGGSGKTPLVIRLCQLLREAGFSPGVVSRGYGRKARGLRLVSPAADPDTTGDEPLLIARRAGVPVVVAENRCDAARALLRRGVDVVVSDDGLQHHRLPRDIEICVVDGKRGFGNGLQIPAGPLRETLDRLESVDHIVINGEGDPVPEPFEIIRMTLVPGMLRSLDGEQAWRLPQFAGCTVNAVAGIGNPDRFFELLGQSRIKVEPFAFPDHHDYVAGDFEKMDSSLPILMTEKDAVKCRDLGLENAWYLAVDVVLPADWERGLLNRILEVKREKGAAA